MNGPARSLGREIGCELQTAGVPFAVANKISLTDAERNLIIAIPAEDHSLVAHAFFAVRHTGANSCEALVRIGSFENSL
jgi:hypothetical protein